MSNQYPHQQEMDAITKNLLEYSEYYRATPMETIREYSLGGIHALDAESDRMEEYEDWYTLNDLEEAVVIKNFCIDYQHKNREYFPNRRKRV